MLRLHVRLKSAVGFFMHTLLKRMHRQFLHWWSLQCVVVIFEAVVSGAVNEFCLGLAAEFILQLNIILMLCNSTVFSEWTCFPAQCHCSCGFIPCHSLFILHFFQLNMIRLNVFCRCCFARPAVKRFPENDTNSWSVFNTETFTPSFPPYCWQWGLQEYLSKGRDSFLANSRDATIALLASEKGPALTSRSHRHSHTFSLLAPSLLLFSPCPHVSAPRSPAAAVLSRLQERGTGLPVLER